MAWSGGVFTRANGDTGWVDDATALIGIEAGLHDTQDNDFKTGINATLTKDGTNTPTANLPMNTYRHTGVGAAVATTDYARFDQVISQTQNSTTTWGGTSGGTANAQTLTLSPAITAYVAGQTFRFISGFTNTGNVTLNVNGLGVKSLLSSATGTNLVPGQITAGFVAEVIYDGTQFQMINPMGTWNTFSPVWTQSGTISYTNNYSKYVQIGKTVHFQCSLLATSAGGGAVAIGVSLPVTASSSTIFGAVGGANYYDAGPNIMYVLSPYMNTTTQVLFVSDASAGNNFGALPAVTVGIGDYINLALTYEAA